MCLCVLCTHMIAHPSRPDVLDSLAARVTDSCSCSRWELETDLVSSARAVCEFNCHAISPVPEIYIVLISSQVCLVFQGTMSFCCCFETGLTMQSWLSWNSLCRPGSTCYSVPTCTFLKVLKGIYPWGQQDSSVDKGACHQVWWSEFNSQDTHSGRRELTSTNCPLILVCVLWHMCPLTCTYMHIK